MSIISFLKEAGEKILGRKTASAATTAADSKPQQNDVATDEREASTAIEEHIKSLGLDVTGLAVNYVAATSTAKVYGVAADQETREKAVLAAGNVEGVAAVDDQMTVSRPAPPAQFYTVRKGDTLSKIAKEFYGDANKYPKIFEANKPMLKDPDKIYPGQNLRIPPKS